MATAQNRMKQLTTKAKQLQKADKKLSWQAALKKAGAAMKSTKVVAKKRAVKKVGAVTTKSKQHTDKNRITANIQVGAKTKDVNRSIENLRAYGEIVKRIAEKEKMIDLSRQAMKKTNDSGYKASYKRVIKSLQKELANLRKQRTIAKQLI